jgi:N-dimethylarginine dimethylaminohydrolase
MLGPVFLMSPPAPTWTVRARANVLSQQTASLPASAGERAFEEWRTLAQAVENAGGTVLVMPPPPHIDLTGLPYTAEAGHFYVDKSGQPNFLLPRMKPPHRHAETTYVAGFAATLGWKCSAPEVTWEGQGDVLWVDVQRKVHTFGIGPYARTGEGAYGTVASALSPKHVQLGFQADPWFHGNTFLGFFGRETHLLMIVCHQALLPGHYQRLKSFVPDALLLELTPAESLTYATNALQVGSTVIAPTGVPHRVLDAWERLGLTPIELAMPMLFGAGGGAGVCLTNRLDGFSPGAIPPHLRLSAFLEHRCNPM